MEFWSAVTLVKHIRRKIHKFVPDGELICLLRLYISSYSVRHLYDFLMASVLSWNSPEFSTTQRLKTIYTNWNELTYACITTSVFVLCPFQCWNDGSVQTRRCLPCLALYLEHQVKWLAPDKWSINIYWMNKWKHKADAGLAWWSSA